MIMALSDAMLLVLLSPISVAVVALLTAITVRLGSIKATGETTHKIVNSQKSDMERYQQTLVAALHHAGVEVPSNPRPHD